MNARCTLVLSAQNKIKGNCKNGNTLTGTWRWSGNNFCRTILLNGKPPTNVKPSDCQKFELSIKDKRVRITSNSTGKSRIYKLTDISIPSSNNENVNQ